MVQRAMLMTAGLGERLRPYSAIVPKPYLPLFGEPLVSLTARSLKDVGVETFVCNVHHLPSVALSALEGLAKSIGGQWIVSDERDRLLGSAGGLIKARDHFQKDPFFLCNGDVISAIDYQALAKAHQINRESFGASVTLAVMRRSPGDGLYNEVFFSSNEGGASRVTGLRGRDNLRPHVPFFTGFAVIESADLPSLPIAPWDFLDKILNPAIQAGKAGAWLSDGIWFDVGSPKLWWQTQLELLKAFETLPDSLPVLWKERWANRMTPLGNGSYLLVRHENEKVLRLSGALKAQKIENALFGNGIGTETDPLGWLEAVEKGFIQSHSLHDVPPKQPIPQRSLTAFGISTQF